MLQKTAKKGQKASIDRFSFSMICQVDYIAIFVKISFAWNLHEIEDRFAKGSNFQGFFAWNLREIDRLEKGWIFRKFFPGIYVKLMIGLNRIRLFRYFLVEIYVKLVILWKGFKFLRDLREIDDGFEKKGSNYWGLFGLKPKFSNCRVLTVTQWRRIIRTK